MKTGFLLAMLAALLLLGLSQMARANCGTGACATGFCDPQGMVYPAPAPVQEAAAPVTQPAPQAESAAPGLPPNDMPMIDQQVYGGAYDPMLCASGYCDPQGMVYPAPAPAPEAAAPVTLPAPKSDTLLTCGIAPFTPPMDYMSQAGYLRWQHYQMTGQWQTPHQALAMAHQERMLCAMK